MYLIIFLYIFSSGRQRILIINIIFIAAIYDFSDIHPSVASGEGFVRLRGNPWTIFALVCELPLVHPNLHCSLVLSPTHKSTWEQPLTNSTLKECMKWWEHQLIGGDPNKTAFSIADFPWYLTCNKVWKTITLWGHVWGHGFQAGCPVMYHGK